MKKSQLLNEAVTPSPRDKGWCKNTVDSILNRQAYLGHLTWNARQNGSVNNSTKTEFFVKQDVHEPIIPNDLWSIVHQVKGLKDVPKQFDTPFLFRGVTYCKKCSCLLKTRVDTPAKSKLRYLNYRCLTCKSNTKQIFYTKIY